MSEFSLNKKVTIAFALLAVLMAAAGVLSVQSASSQRAASSEISEVWLPSVNKSSEINLNVTRFRLAELDFLSAEDMDARTALKSRMEEYQQNLFIYRKVFEPLIRGEKQQKLYDQFSETWDKYSEAHDQLIAAIEAGKKEEASQLLSSTDSQFEILSRDLSQLSDESFMAATNASEVAGTAFQRGKWISISLSTLSVLLVFLVGFLIRRDVKNRLGPISEETQSSADQIYQTVDVLVRSSSQLSNSSMESAASLEETVTSMAQLTAAVRLNAEHARTAAELSQEGEKSVSQGQQDIQLLIANIKEVHEASKKISEILVLIDDISFQTNLLALNAAVEAARAGEQGKGFAVVAEAVRALAQKSADSAKEISGLINSSNEKTKAGVQFATRSEQSLNEIVSSVSKVGSLIQEISTAAQEQDAGLSQVGKALGQIDQAIQGNTSNTLAISDAAKSLQKQAEILNASAQGLGRFSGVKVVKDENQNENEVSEQKSNVLKLKRKTS